MKKLNYIISAYLLLVTFHSNAQHARFVTQGTITYEKRVNAYALIKQQIKIWGGGDDSFYKAAFESYQKNNPQFKTSQSTLYFDNDVTAFIPTEDAIASTSGWFGDMIEFKQANHILTDIKAGTSKTQKKVYDETYMVSDSTRKINWKITKDTASFSGVKCQKATAYFKGRNWIAWYAPELPFQIQFVSDRTIRIKTTPRLFITLIIR